MVGAPTRDRARTPGACAAVTPRGGLGGYVRGKGKKRSKVLKMPMAPELPSHRRPVPYQPGRDCRARPRCCRLRRRLSALASRPVAAPRLGFARRERPPPNGPPVTEDPPVRRRAKLGSIGGWPLAITTESEQLGHPLAPVSAASRDRCPVAPRRGRYSLGRGSPSRGPSHLG